MIVKKKLNHGRNPIIEWMNRNVVIVSDHNGNIKFDKAKSKEKIDGMVALAMAVAQHIKYKNTIPDGSSDIVAL
jgi:phage terminase large subunit-like protein